MSLRVIHRRCKYINIDSKTNKKQKQKQKQNKKWTSGHKDRVGGHKDSWPYELTFYVQGVMRV